MVRFIAGWVVAYSGVALAAEAVPYGHKDFYPSPEQPVGWRGDGAGGYPGATPVVEWDEKSGRNIVFKVSLPFLSNATSIVVGDKVFVTADPCWLICLSARDGKELWRRTYDPQLDEMPAERREALFSKLEKVRGFIERVSAPTQNAHLGYDAYENVVKDTFDDADEERLKKLAAAAGTTIGELQKIHAELRKLGYGAFCSVPSMTMPTPISDGRNVYVVFYGNDSAVTAFDLAGNRRWVHTFRGKAGKGVCSPVLAGKLLVFQQSGEKLAAVSTADGSPAWTAPAFLGAWGSGSPIRVRANGGDVIVSAGGAVVRTADGKLLSEFAGGGTENGGSPAAVGATVYFPCISNIKMGQTGHLGPVAVTMTLDGDAFKAEEVMRAGPRAGRGKMMQAPFTSVCCYRGAIYSPTSGGRRCGATVGDAATGNRLGGVRGDRGSDEATAWTYTSATGAGDYVFVTATMKPANVHIFKAGTAEVVGEATIDDTFVASPVFQGDRMFLRTWRHLYCIGDKSKPWHTPQGAPPEARVPHAP